MSRKALGNVLARVTGRHIPNLRNNVISAFSRSPGDPSLNDSMILLNFLRGFEGDEHTAVLVSIFQMVDERVRHNSPVDNWLFRNSSIYTSIQQGTIARA